MSATCPACLREQQQGLLCHACTSLLEMELGDVPAIVVELDITLSRQSRIGSGGRGGLASERNPWQQRASIAADALQNTLTTWARDLCGDTWRPGVGAHPTHAAAGYLLLQIDAIRKHPAVDELLDQVVDAIRQARREVDRPADRQYLGVCLADHEGVACTEELWARPSAAVARCKVCGSEYDVADRRVWLLEQAADRVVTVREAARVVGSVGRIAVTEDRIRGYLRRGRLAYRPMGAGERGIRLGDLLTLVVDDAERRPA